jgi:hypothetical protein
MESFLLRSPAGIKPALDWIEDVAANGGNPANKWRLLRQAGGIFRQLHRANFYLETANHQGIENVFAVGPDAWGEPQIVLDQVDRLESRRHESAARARQDLRKLGRTRARRILTRTDYLRFLLAYCEAKSLGNLERRLWRQASNQSGAGLVLARMFGL